MARKRYQAEKIIGKLRAIEVHIAKGLKADEDGSGEQLPVGVTPRGETYKLACNAQNASEFAGT